MKKLKLGEAFTYYEYVITFNIIDNDIEEGIDKYCDRYRENFNKHYYNIIEEKYNDSIDLSYRYLSKKDLTIKIKDEMVKKIFNYVKERKKEKLEEIKCYDMALKNNIFKKTIRKDKLNKIV